MSEAHEDSESHLGYGNSLKHLASQLNDFAGPFSELAKQAEIDQVTNSTIAGDMAEVAAAVRQVAGNSDTYFEQWAADPGATRDRTRAHDPRKSVRAEGHVDVEYTLRDE